MTCCRQRTPVWPLLLLVTGAAGEEQTGVVHLTDSTLARAGPVEHIFANASGQGFTESWQSEEERRLKEGHVRNAGLSHWGLHGHGGHAEGAGSSWHTRAFDLLNTGYALKGFQIGLGGAWLLPDGHFDRSKCPCRKPGVETWCTDGTCRNRGGCADVWETMEGGLGYWRGELPSKHVKWRLNNVNGCYACEMMSTLWTFLGRPIKCEDMGFVIVTNRFLMPPDGLSFENPPDYGMMGQAFMRTTLGRTGPAENAKGSWTYLLLLDTANFKGPVGYTLEEFWRDNKGYDEAPDFSHSKIKIGSTGFEFNGVEGYTSSQDETTFLKIPKLKFPMSSSKKTTIMTGVRGWGAASLQTPLERALEGATLPRTMMRVSEGQQAWCHSGWSDPLKLGFQNFPLIKLGGRMSINRRADTGECVSEIIWDSKQAVCEGGIRSSTLECVVPDLWQLKKPRALRSTVDWSSVNCKEKCRDAGYCCNDDVGTGSNQYLSCLQACDIRKHGTDEKTCLGHCSEVANNRGCSRTINGQRYNMCGKCSDIKPGDKCVWGVGGRDACDFGCVLRESKERKTEPFMEPVLPDMLPSWSKLASRRFPEKKYEDVPKLDGLKNGGADHGSCLKSPGPARKTVFCARTRGGSIVKYQWFKFVDQPALQRSKLTPSQRAYLQRRIERLHELLARDAPRNSWMETPPEASPLAEIDSSLLVVPPAGLEKGYVPVPVAEGPSDEGCTDSAPYQERERTFVRWRKCKQSGFEGNCGDKHTKEACLATAEDACNDDPSCVAVAMRMSSPSFATYFLYHDAKCVNDQAYGDHYWNLYVKRGMPTMEGFADPNAQREPVEVAAGAAAWPPALAALGLSLAAAAAWRLRPRGPAAGGRRALVPAGEGEGE